MFFYVAIVILIYILGGKDGAFHVLGFVWTSDGFRRIVQFRLSKEDYLACLRVQRAVHRRRNGDNTRDRLDVVDALRARVEGFARLFAKGLPTIVIVGKDYLVS